MKQLVFFLPLLFVGLFSYSQSISKIELEGIYYGSISKGYSQLKEPMVFRFYKDGLVMVEVLDNQPKSLEVLEQVFSKMNKKKFGYAEYSLDANYLEFYAPLKGITALYEGNIKAMGEDMVIQFQAKDAKGTTYNIIVNKVWPEKKTYAPEPPKPVVSQPTNTTQPTNKTELKVVVPENDVAANNVIEEVETSLDEKLENNELGKATNEINSLGVIEYEKGNYEEALDYFDDALNYSLVEEDSISLAAICQNIGACYEQTGQLKKAEEYYYRSAAVSNKLGNKSGEGKSVFALSEMYRNSNQFDSEKKMLLKLIELEKGNNKEQSASYNNLSINLLNEKALDSSELVVLQGIELAEKTNDQVTLGKLYNNLGNIKYEDNDFDASIEKYMMAASIQDKIGASRSQSLTYFNLANAFLAKDQKDSAMHYYNLSLDIAKEVNYQQVIYSDYLGLSKLYESEQCKPPLDYYKMYAALRFSINEVDELKQLADYSEKYITQQQMENNSLSEEVLALKEAADESLVVISVLKENIRKKDILAKLTLSEEEKKNKILEQDKKILSEQKNAAQQESAKKTYMIVGVSGIGVLAIAMMLLAVRSSRKNKRAKEKIADQKDQIEQQHQSLEEQHQEITDSITYAKRLQGAMLPQMSIFKEQFKDSFLLFKPKDIVSGDFYWTEKKHGVILFAAADCTGHGVPGAMVSVICNNALNRSVREFNLNDPGKILDKAREIVVQEFEKSSEEVKDGMDISLGGLMGKTLYWAGANNPLWIIRNGDLIEYKADKQPVGKHDHSTPFTSHRIGLEDGDCLYVFSDGFADQFGGPKGKKFMAGRFKKLLISVQNKPMEEQSKALEKAFEEWREEQEQLDDVCVIGVRI